MERCGGTVVRFILLFLFFIVLFNINPTSCNTTPCIFPADAIQTRPFTIENLSMHANTINNYYGPGSQYTGCHSREDKWYSIKTAASSLVIDANDPVMKIQEFTGSPQQMWKFEPAERPGVYYIVNNHTGTVLDYTPDSLEVIVNKKNGSLNQQWILNSNGRIFNVGKKYNIDVTNAQYVPGNILHVWINNGNEAQEFTIQENSK